MCYNCGCFNPDDDMGNLSNITHHTIDELSKHWKKSPEETKVSLYNLLLNGELDKDQYLSEMFSKAASAWGQSVDEAKKNTLALLKSELKK